MNWMRGLAAAGLVAALAIGAIVGVTRLSPSVGAQGADELRKVLGDENVARIEMAFFKVDDTVKKWEYGLGIGKAEAPWVAAPAKPAQSGLTYAQPAPVSPSGAISRRSVAPLIAGKPAPVVVAAPWPPAGLAPLGSLPGEGVWVPYIQDGSGRVLASKTFVQPDPTRPYALVAVVAFNLSETRLHFILGTDEPYAPSVTLRASGAIPAQDLRPGALLATFNGGFKVAHGHFGAMAGGLTSVPPRDGLATLAIYQDGTVRMGAWGSEIKPSTDMVAFRQNGALIIHAGQITTQVDDPHLWGYTINGDTVTWRSAVGLDATGTILYYFAGPYINIGTLAKAVAAAKVETAMQLDINNYWVHFAAIRSTGGKLTPEPLLKEMNQNPDRYLRRFTRDYFYVTVK